MMSCEFDNYDEPNAMLSGRIVYQGEPIQVASNEVFLELWEPGWQLRNRIDVVMDQDGSYSASLFDAEYKLVFRENQGPFQMITNPQTQSDTILATVRGNTTMDIEVMPYHMIRNPQIFKIGDSVDANVMIEQIIGGDEARSVESVGIYLNTTQFVDNRGNYNVAVHTLSAGEIENLSAVSLSVPIPDLVRPQNFIFARIGVRIQGVQHMIFSPVQRIDL